MSVLVWVKIMRSQIFTMLLKPYIHNISYYVNSRENCKALFLFIQYNENF